MATFKQKTSKPDFAGRPLPFRSRAGLNQQMNPSPYISQAALRKREGSPSRTNSGKNGLLFSSSNKENVRSWLESTSKVSPLSSTTRNQQEADLPPPTPSPICSPSAVSTPLSSPYMSSEQVHQNWHLTPATSGNVRCNEHYAHPQTRSQGRQSEELTTTIRENGKKVFNEPPPGSPTGSTLSSGSEGGILALLASKLLSYKETGRRSSRYAKESSGPIDEKHVVDDRSQKPAVEEIASATAMQTYLHPQDSDVYTVGRSSSLYRTASEAVSEISLGSANGRTLSMEFDAMLAAAVATGIHQATTFDEQHPQQLPEIQEDVSRAGSMGAVQWVNADARALVSVGDEEELTNDDEAGRLTRSLTVMRQDQESDDMDFRSTLSDVLVPSRGSVNCGSRRVEVEEINALQMVPTTIGVLETADVGILHPPRSRESSRESSPSGLNGDNRLAMVLATQPFSHVDHTTSSSSSNSGQSKEKDMSLIVPIPASQALEKVRRDKIQAQATAFQDAKSAKCNNRYKREESKITVWENQQNIKASLRMKKVEMRLEQKRAKALEKMQNEIARAHKTAEVRKASAEAVRASKTAKVVQEADSFRKTGKVPSTATVGCFPF